MDDARLFVCARCKRQVLICSRCDRGQEYCVPTTVVPFGMPIPKAVTGEVSVSAGLFHSSGAGRCPSAITCAICAPMRSAAASMSLSAKCA